ncbi:MAG: hypothetical protein K9J30_08410 [Bacteroidales bacterium]|nr:hypothetical protein [Bacteroidales bacterium]
MKTIKTITIVVVIILVVPLVGFTGWILKRNTALDIMVINKSMLHFDRSENKSLNYILNKEKVFTPFNTKYNLKKDYYGLFWFGDEYNVRYPRLKDVSETAENVDLVYYADAYGIKASQIGGTDSNRLEYGGISNTDYTLIKELMSRNKYLIAECSFFGSPTEPLIRYNLEQLTDIYFVGWHGRYIKNLANEPDCDREMSCTDMYREYVGEEWNAKGPGIVFFNPESKRILVLEEGKDIQSTNGLIKTTSEGVEKFGLPEEVNYSGWFTVLHPGRNKTISSFVLNPTEEGHQKLNKMGIPDNFPALIQADNHFFYLAGDFGKNNVRLFPSRLWGINDLINLPRKRSKRASNFYYSYYQPFVTTIIDEVAALSKDK